MITLKTPKNTFLFFTTILFAFQALGLSNNPLFVVHASREFDPKMEARKGIFRIVNQFTKNNSKIFYLKNDLTPIGEANWYAPKLSQAEILFSEGGEHNIDTSEVNEVTLVGGYFGTYDGSRGCQTLATRDVIRMHFEKSQTPLQIHWPISAIYFYEQDQIFRKNLLALLRRSENQMTAPSNQELNIFFQDFETNFLLTDNFSDEIQFGHPYSHVGHKNTSYREGTPITLDRFQFNLYFNKQFIKNFGRGRSVINLIIEK